MRVSGARGGCVVCSKGSVVTSQGDVGARREQGRVDDGRNFGGVIGGALAATACVLRAAPAIARGFCLGRCLPDAAACTRQTAPELHLQAIEVAIPPQPLCLERDCLDPRVATTPTYAT